MAHRITPEQWERVERLRAAFSEHGYEPPSFTMYWDRDGEPIDIALYSVLMEDAAYKRVARTVVGPYVVSTVWLGIDYGMAAVYRMSDKPTALFETMVFGDGPEHDLDCRRWATEAEALAGHEEVVTLVRATT